MDDQTATLADRLRQSGAMRPDEAARVLLPVADELAARHRDGTAHGGLSPAAVAIDADGRGRLLERGEVVVDPAYLPPGPDRSWRPRPADDVWSLAAVLTMATTGSPPDRAPTPRAAGWLTPITELALAPDDRDRPSMADLADYLRARAEPSVAPATERRRPALVVVGAAALASLAATGAALLLVGGENDDAAPPPPPEASARASASASARPTATASAPQVDDAQLARFAREYVATASADPARGFALLTPEYQRRSPRYEQVWRSIRAPRILSLTTDPATLSVTYTYRYSRPDGQTRTEVVTLRLVSDDDRLLIAGATARPA